MLTTTLDQLSLLIAKKDYQSISIIFPEMVSVYKFILQNIILGLPKQFR